jgi:ketosteroid isomerase-like protein
VDPGLSPAPGSAPTALGECFAPDACLIAADGTEVHGEAAIRARLAELIASHAEVAIEFAGVLCAGDVALAYERWSFGEEGEGVQGSSPAPHPTLVLRRVGEEWKLAIAAPWGWAPAAGLEAVYP